MSQKIPIDSITGDPHGNDLMGCFFMQKHDGDFNFHDKDDHTKARNLNVGSTFSFRLDEYPDVEWTLTIATASATEVTGSWKTDKQEPSLADGGYQAQAGGGVDAESSASAYA
jgi:hypothetical protein